MRPLGQSRLTVRILFWVICIAILMFSVVTAFTILQERKQAYQAAQQDADRNVSRIIEAISLALWNFDKITLDATLVALTQSGSIVRAEVRDVQNQFVSRIERADQRTKPDIEWEISIRSPDESRQIGTLKISESYADLRGFFASSLASRLVSEVIKIGGLAALLFIVIYTVVARHLHMLAREVSDADPRSAVEPVRLQRRKVYHDELDTLVDSINRFRKQRVEAEEALWAARAELARVTQATTLAQMAASIAHQISQSLTAIGAYSNAALRWLARSPPRIDEASAALKNIAQDAHHAGEVIRSIRAIFQKDSQKLTSFSINGLVQEVLGMLDVELRSKRVSVSVDLQDGLPQLLADRVQLQQVFVNLVVNAVESMESITDRERVLRIKSCAQDGSVILVTVEDTGIGMDEQSGDRIFDAFFTTKGHGMGMGLSICRSIIEAHHGRLWASPGFACGSIFHVTLPAGEPGANSTFDPGSRRFDLPQC